MELKIEDGVSEIPASKCAGNAEIESVFIPSSVVKIGKCAFNGCKNLRDVEFEGGGKELEIGESAFEGCSSLTEVELPARPLRLLSKCFKGSGLERISVASGCGLARDFYLFQGCPAEQHLRNVIEEAISEQAAHLFGKTQKEHSYPVCALTRKLQACTDEGMLATALQSIYERMKNNGDFDVCGYSAKYKESCDKFSNVSDWMSIDNEQVKSLVSGIYARHVAFIDFGEIWDWEWNDDNLSQMREICASVRGDDFDEDALREKFYHAFSRIRHHAAFHRLMAAAHPKELVQIPAIATLVPLYSWLAKQNPPTVEQAKWYELSHGVRVALSKMLPNVDEYNAGVFAWYLANAFRDNPKGDDVKRKELTLGWMCEFGLIRN